jgi:tetratricopeptide (TPR) repeat protein
MMGPAMAWREFFRSMTNPLLAGSLLVAVAVPAAEAQKLPPAVAAAANPVADGQALVKQGKFAEALAKFGEAQGAANGIPQPTLKLFYQVTARLGSATALDGMQRYDAALEHCDWANETVPTPAARQLPDALRAAVHHICGVTLYHLKRTDEAKTFFQQAAKEGDKTAADWEKAISAPPVSMKPADLAVRADEAAQSGKLGEALLLYMLALEHYDALGDKAGAVMERALAVALRMDPPAPIPEGSADRLKAADAALQSGTPAALEDARDLMTQSVIVVPWWSDGWKRLADIEEKLGDLPAARGALRYYLKATPKAADRDAVEQRVAGLGQRIASGGAVPPPAADSGALAAAAGDAASAPPAATTEISGNWSTTDGRIIAVKQNGNQVSWASCCKPGHEDLVVNVSGTFDGKNLVGTYHYREGQAEGNGTATYTLAGDRLEGVWKTPDGKSLPTALVRHPGEAPGSLAGKWTTAIGRTVSLTQTGEQVRWTTCCRQAHPNWTADITASFDGKNLVGTYHWRDGGQQGNGTVMYALNGNQLEGTLERPGKDPYHSVLTRQADGSLAGKWTTSTGGTLTLSQKGNDVTGTNCCRPDHPNYTGDVSGAFDGKNFVGVFHYRDGNAQGMGTFIYALNDGGQLEGSFKPAGGAEVKSVLTRQ